MRAQGGRLALRLLFVIKTLSGPAGGGGAERVLSLLTAELAERRHEVEIASFDAPDSTDFHRFDGRIVRHRLAIGEVARNSAPVELLARVPALRRLIRGRKPDVCIGFMHSTFVPLSFAAIGTRIPIIASEHTAFDHYRAFGFQGALVRATARVFAAFTVTSERVRSGFPWPIARRMTVIPNPIVFPDTKGRSEFGNHVLLSVGGLRAEKGHETLIAAFARLADRFCDWTLRLVGDGARRAALERQVDEAGLRDRVVFLGALQDVTPEYLGADLFAAPSPYESFGIATAEALAAEVPAVGFADSPGTNELIQDSVNGLLVSGPDRVEALANGLARLMVDDELRRKLGEAGPASVARYAVEPVTDQWEDLLRWVASH